MDVVMATKEYFAGEAKNVSQIRMIWITKRVYGSLKPIRYLTLNPKVFKLLVDYFSLKEKLFFNAFDFL